MNQLESIFAEILHVATPSQLISMPVSLVNPQFNGADLSVERNRFGYEPDILAALSVFSRGDRTFVDIGSNWGYFPVHQCVQTYFNGQIVAIEPSHLCYGDLVKVVTKCRLGGRVRCVNKALGTAKGHAYLSEDAWTGNCTLNHSGDSGELVCVDTLDDLGITEPGFIKIDVEGFEPQVIAGGWNLIQAAQPTLVFEDWLKEGHFPAIHERLTSAGYRCFALSTKLEQELGYPSRVTGALTLKPIDPAARAVAEERMNILAITDAAIALADDLRLG
jgi:FkbM family methyltransferase